MGLPGLTWDSLAGMGLPGWHGIPWLAWDSLAGMVFPGSEAMGTAQITLSDLDVPKL